MAGHTSEDFANWHHGCVREGDALERATCHAEPETLVDVTVILAAVLHQLERVQRWLECVPEHPDAAAIEEAIEDAMAGLHSMLRNMVRHRKAEFAPDWVCRFARETESEQEGHNPPLDELWHSALLSRVTVAE